MCNCVRKCESFRGFAQVIIIITHDLPTTRLAAVPRLRCPGQAVRHPNQILPSIALTAPYLSYGLAPVPEDVRFARSEHAGMKLRPVAHLSLFSNKTNADAPSSHRAQSRITFTSATRLTACDGWNGTGRNFDQKKARLSRKERSDWSRRRSSTLARHTSRHDILVTEEATNRPESFNTRSAGECGDLIRHPCYRLSPGR
jgi:hypothetical protein